jgi:hypothetical protein
LSESGESWELESNQNGKEKKGKKAQNGILIQEYLSRYPPESLIIVSSRTTRTLNK